MLSMEPGSDDPRLSVGQSDRPSRDYRWVRLFWRRLSQVVTSMHTRPLREQSDLGPALSTNTTTLGRAPPSEKLSRSTAIAQEQPQHAAVSQK